MGRQIDPLGSSLGTVHQYIVACPVVKAEMGEGVRQARQMVAVKSEQRVAAAGAQLVEQDSQHLIRSGEAIEIAQQ